MTINYHNRELKKQGRKATTKTFEASEKVVTDRVK